MSAAVMASDAVLIRPRSGWQPIDLREIWRYRELLWFLAWRDVSVRYKQTAFGVAWAVLQPLFTMLVYSIFFGRLAKMPSDGLPYPLFVLVGLLPVVLMIRLSGRRGAELEAGGTAGAWAEENERRAVAA